VPNPDGSGDKLIVEALSYGIAFDLVDLTIDRATGDVVAKSGDVPETPHDIAGDPRVAALVERYRRRVAPVAMRVVGDTETALTRAGGELGRLTAAAEREYARADAAAVDAGALRADIDPGPITYADVAEALAYGHPVTRARITGRELSALVARAGYFSGPAEIDPDRTYTVAASEMTMDRGRALGSEADALAWYLER
jgi:5'-nucleotidase